MMLRQLLGAGALGAAVWALWRRGAITLPGTAQSPSSGRNSASATPSSAGAGFTSWLVARESGGNLAAKNPRSSASGKYQFTRDTWLRMGGAWGPDMSRPFGGLTPSEAEQDARYERLTAGNADALRRAGLAVTAASLYAAHFLGAPTAVRVLRAPDTARVAGLVGRKVISANPFLRGYTVGDFRRWAGARG